MLLMKLFITIILICISLTTQSTPQLKLAIQQATPYKKTPDVNLYWISEKLDGIRGYWDGKQLLTRQGNKIYSPKWFTKNWPNYALDGELWMQRDYFQQTLSCVRKKTADKTCWQYIHFMIFDLPEHGGAFTQRIIAMQRLTKETNSPYLSMIKQFKLAPPKKLEQHLAIQVKTNEGIIFKIGSGFSDKERYTPPAIGSIITFKYNGKTRAGIPRFARFYRVRQKGIKTVN